VVSIAGERLAMGINRSILCTMALTFSLGLRISSADDPDSLGWCLPTGFSTPITYFYLAYFVVLLVHRQIRDDEACKVKYGQDWEKVGTHTHSGISVRRRGARLICWAVLPDRAVEDYPIRRE
jgi:hypothetical protein